MAAPDRQSRLSKRVSIWSAGRAPRPSVDEITRESITADPERTLRTPLSVVVDAFLVRTPQDSVRQDYSLRGVLLNEN